MSHDPLGPHEEGGVLHVQDCNALRDLSGLDALTEFAELSTQTNAQLESLTGLQVPSTLRSVTFFEEPTLRDLSALAPLQSVGSLVLDNTNVVNLDALQLNSADEVFLRSNTSLEQVDSLGSLRSLRKLVVADNDRLQELPGFEEVQGVEIASVVGNAELRSVPSFQASVGGIAEGFGAYTDSPYLLRNLTYYGFDLFEVGDNPKLSRITPMGAAHTARQIVIYSNASLTEIDFGVLTSLSSLQIVENAALARIGWISPYAQVSVLHVINNPLLSVAPFASVQTLTSELSGNLDSP